MDPVFPYAHIVAGILILIVGFLFHWLGQLISIVNWDLAVRLGLQEKDAPPEYRVYEHSIAVSDVAIGWIYGVAGVGLLLGVPWAFKLAWAPGVVLVYHALGFVFWTRNQRKAGYDFYPGAFRGGWILANLTAGAMAVLVAWHAC